MKETFTITEEEKGLRLQDVLAERYPLYSVGTLLKIMADGKVLVNDEPSKRRRQVTTGDRVEIDFPDEGLKCLEPEPREFEVLYEDASCVVINKPAGLAVVPERYSDDYPLMAGMLYYLQHDSPYATGQMIRPMIVHRLDKDTTGALVIAKSLDALRSLTSQFEQRTVHKEYLAIVRGQPPEETSIDLPISTKGVKRGRAVISHREGRPSFTSVVTEEYFRGFALVRAIPKTGRQHQVRLHLKAAGYPLIVDPLYVGPREGEHAFYLSEIKRSYRPKSGQPERPLIARQALHAYRLTFDIQSDPENPGTAARVTAEAPLPEDMEIVLKMLRKYRRL